MLTISGLIALDGGPLDRRLLEELPIARGVARPSGSVSWRDELAALSGTIAIDRPSGRVAAVDARLDHREDLIARLGIDASEVPLLSDGDLVLRAFSRWGEDCPSRIEGDWAFAIWDPGRRALFAARDPFGIRPLHYHVASRAFAFSSRLADLAGMPGMAGEVVDETVARYILGVPCDRGATFFAGIRRLPPGHRMSVEDGRVRVDTWWRAEARAEVRADGRPRRDEDLVEEFRDLFLAAVRSRIGDPARCGALLSGGLDSSSIACATRDLLGRDSALPLRTFSLRFPESIESDEGAWIDAVMARGGFAPRMVDGSRLDPLADLDEDLEDAGEPPAAPNGHLHRALYRAAASEGVRCLLDGLDGDTTVSHGLLGLADLLRAGRPIALGREVLALSRRLPASPWSILWRKSLKPSIPRSILAASRRARRRWGCAGSGIPRLAPDLALRLGWDGGRPPPEDGGGPRGEREHHRRRLEGDILARAFEWADRAATAAGIEPRYPFMDRRLVEFCLSLPGRAKLRDGWTRWILRAAMEGILPEEVRWRGGKADLGHPFRRALLGRHREALEDLARGGRSPVEGWVDRGCLGDALARVTRGRSTADEPYLWRCLVLDRWSRRRGPQRNETGRKELARCPTSDRPAWSR
jgi:asparagine synthase (glutamine-hydrolysing)